MIHDYLVYKKNETVLIGNMQNLEDEEIQSILKANYPSTLSKRKIIVQLYIR